MKYKYYTDPINFLVIDNFFTKGEYDYLYESILKLDHLMEDGYYTKVDDLGNAKSDIVDEKTKKNKNIWIYDTAHKDNEECKKIARLIEGKIWNDDMRRIYNQSSDSAFKYYFMTNRSDILISKYNKGGHYNWHRDLLKSVTGNIWLSKDKVDGGHLLFKSEDNKYAQVEFRDNACVMFPSECLHKVTPVENDVTRYSIQYFSKAIYNQ